MTGMRCWMKFSDSHGLIGYDPIWLPAGDTPETDTRQYRRVQAMDFYLNKPDSFEDERLALSNKMKDLAEDLDQFVHRHTSKYTNERQLEKAQELRQLATYVLEIEES